MFMSANKEEFKISKPVTESDLQGEWESKSDKGELLSRLIVNGNKFTCYSLLTNGSYDSETGTTTITKFVMKEVGTFSIKDNEFTITYDTLYNSMRSDLVEGTWVYRFSDYDPATLEANEWLSEQPQGYSEVYIIYRDGANLYWGFGRGGAAFRKK